MRLSANTRRAIYGVALAAIALLVSYGFIHDEQRELWTSLVYALLALAPATALAHVTPDPVQEPDAGLDILDPAPDGEYQPELPFDEDSP